MQPLQLWHGTSLSTSALADGRHLLLPIRVLPGDGTQAVASLITNQASFRVLDAIADVLTAQVAQLGPKS
jgi:hypothetical protein